VFVLLRISVVSITLSVVVKAVAFCFGFEAEDTRTVEVLFFDEDTAFSCARVLTRSVGLVLVLNKVCGRADFSFEIGLTAADLRVVVEGLEKDRLVAGRVGFVVCKGIDFGDVDTDLVDGFPIVASVEDNNNLGDWTAWTV
jgi:hypothetical protein